MAVRRVQSRSWFGTLNNYTGEELAATLEFQAHCVYLAIGFHVGEKSHLPHIHVVVQFKNPRGWPKLSPRFHWEVRRGTITEAVNYLNKDGQLQEFGERPRDPKSIDAVWAELVQSIHTGTVDKDSRIYAQNEGYVKRRLAELRPRQDYEGDLRDKNLWIWGPAGCGKSRAVRMTFSPSQIYTKFLNKWWDAYEYEPCVLIEDADPYSCKILAHHFKVWCDRYSFGAEMKHGRMQINPCDYNLIVTSNYTIEECFEERDVDPILRRFEVVKLPIEQKKKD